MINSSSNSQVKNVIQLQTKAKARREQKCFVIEGQRICEEIPKDRIVNTYISESYFNKMDEKSKEKIGIYEIVEDSVFKNMCETVTPQGILAIAKKMQYSVDDVIQCNEANTFIVLEDIQDPGNLGTIVRTAEGAGVAGIIMSRGTVDIYNPKVVRSTMGSIFRVPFVYVDNIIDTVKIMKQNNITTYAAHLSGTEFYYDKDYTKKSAFLIGNEGNGLTDELTGQADQLIKIPMCGKVESLNAANAATILMYEALRQNKISK